MAASMNRSPRAKMLSHRNY